MQLQSGCAYRIQNKYSKMYISVSGCSIAPKAKIMQKPERHRSEDFLSSQTWYLYQSTRRHFIMINKKSGLLLNIVDNSKDADTAAVQEDLQATNNNSQTWYMSLSPEASDDCPYLRIMNANSNKFLTSSGIDADTIIHQCYLLEYAPYNDVQLWEFIVVNQLNVPDIVCSNDFGTVNITPQTSFDRPQPEQSDPVLLGRMLLPFVLVHDNVLDRLEQSALSPFYQLHRYRFWKMVHFHYHTGIGELSDGLTVYQGLLTGNNQAVRDTLGISVHLSGSFRLSDIVCRLISGKIKRELRVKTKCGGTNEHGEEKLMTILSPAGREASYALWTIIDRFVLLRNDGTEILEWRTNMESTFNLVAFPRT